MTDTSSPDVATFRGRFDAKKIYSVLALDLGAHTGWAAANNHGKIVDSGSIHFTGEPALRYGALLTWLEERLPAHAIVIEAALPTRAVSNKDIIGYAAIAAAVAVKHGLAFETYHNATVKKAVTGSGNADKPAVRKFVERLTGRKVGSFDEADACAVALTHINRSKRARGK